MIQMSVDGIVTSNQMWRTAEKVLASNWESYYGSASTKNYYALYSAVKCLRLARPRQISLFESTGLDWYHDATCGVEQTVTGHQSADGSWNMWYQEEGAGLSRDLSTAWAIMMLTPSVIAQPPVAVIDAPQLWRFDVPLHFSGSDSYHIDSNKRIFRWHWDFDNDGKFDYTTTDPEDPAAAKLWPDPTPGVPGDAPQQVTIRLRVEDNNVPSVFDETTATLTVRESPLPPYARDGGPYEGITKRALKLDGSGSFDLDAGDILTLYEWDLNNDGTPDITETDPEAWHTFLVAGEYTIGLRVTDNGAFNGGTKMVSEWDYTSALIQDGFGLERVDPAGRDVEVAVDATPGRTYHIMARDNNFTAAPYVLHTRVAAGDFVHTDPGVVGTVDRRFYQAVQEDAGVVETDRTVYAAYVFPTEPGAWYRLSMPIDLGASNTLDSLLGEQLERGISGDHLNGDLLYVLDGNGDWRRYQLDGTTEWTSNGVPSADGVSSWQSFWIKRRSSGMSSNAVYTGKVYTNAEPITFRANDWHMIAWPFPKPRREDAGVNKGWGFAAAGARKGTSWLNADKLMVGEDTETVFLFLNEDGRWYRLGGATPAGETTLQAGEGYYYYHAGTGFTWTAAED